MAGQAGYYKTLTKQPNFKHAVGIAMVVQSVHHFTPTPNMSPMTIAYHKGVDAGVRGLGTSANPYDSQPNLSAEWMRGFNEQTNYHPPRLAQQPDGSGD